MSLDKRLQFGHQMFPGVQSVEDVGVAPGQRLGRGLGPCITRVVSRVRAAARVTCELVDLLVYPAAVILHVAPEPAQHRVPGAAGGLGQVQQGGGLVWSQRNVVT